MARIAFLTDLPKDSGAGSYAVELQKMIPDTFAIDYLYFYYDQRTLVLEGQKESWVLAMTQLLRY